MSVGSYLKSNVRESLGEIQKPATNGVSRGENNVDLSRAKLVVSGTHPTVPAMRIAPSQHPVDRLAGSYGTDRCETHQNRPAHPTELTILAI